MRAVERRVGTHGRFEMQCVWLPSDRKHEVTVDQAKRCDFDGSRGDGVEVMGLLSNPSFGEKLRELIRPEGST